ncbi:hypothetical protein NODU109028_13415 [Nocardioides dubius]
MSNGFSGGMLTVSSSGYPPGGSAELRIVSTSPLGLTAELPPFCQSGGPLSPVAVCTLDATRPGFKGWVTLGPWEQITLTLTANGFEDSDDGNNTWSSPAR